jgi:quinol monooxygenase YgiN
MAHRKTLQIGGGAIALLMIMYQPAAPAQTRNTMLYIATYIDVQLSSTNSGTALILQYCEAARKEKGNSGAEVVHEFGRPNHFVVVEVWNDQPSFEAHERAEHTVQFRNKLKAIHNSPYDQRVHLGFAIDPRRSPAGRETVSVVTHVDVPPPRKDETEALLKGLAEESRKDDGNLQYDVFQQTAPRTNHFTLFAVWQDRKAFDSHEMKPHTRESREVLAPMLGAPYDERLYAPLK